jgi:DNA-binding FadR family transcriptional regulator
VIGRLGGTAALQPIPRVSLQDAIIARLGQLIDQEQIRPGARLPPELTLARALRVSRSSIREAVSALVSYGLLTRRAGHGTYVTSGVGQLITRGLALRLTLDPQSFQYVLEARQVLEGEFAYLAALRADVRDLEAIDHHLEAMRVHARNPEVSVKEDFAFHMAIARSAKNPVLFDVLNYLSDLVFRSHRAVTQSGGLSPSAITYHERIAAAIRRRAAREARRVMLQHLADCHPARRSAVRRGLRSAGRRGRDPEARRECSGVSQSNAQGEQKGARGIERSPPITAWVAA